MKFIVTRYSRTVVVLLATFCFVSQGLLTFPASAIDSAVLSTSTREGRLAVFDDAWATIASQYYDPTFRELPEGQDWTSQQRMFREQAGEANSSNELYSVLRRMIASLNDPHTRVFAPDEKFDWWRPRFVSIGLSIREVDGLPTVVHVESGSAAKRAGIQAGDVIETVDGKPALSLINQRLAAAQSVSNPVSSFSKARIFATLAEGPAETWAIVSWIDRQGKMKSARLHRYWQERELGMGLRKTAGFAIVDMEVFTRKTSADFLGLLKEKIRNSRGLILDLRNNGGGDSEAMIDVTSAFLGDGFRMGRFTDRSGTTLAVTTRFKSPFLAPPIPRTKAPIVILTSERTASAAEILIAALKESKRAGIIGTDTCGCVLAIRTRHQLPDGGLLDVSELGYQTTSGNSLEGHGIKPDAVAISGREDLCNQRRPNPELQRDSACP